jgi:hypothetical protein
MDDPHWANVIRAGSSDEGVMAVIDALNALSAARRCNIADVLVGCAQMLAQTITFADPEIAKEIRAGIMTLIDGYATRLAIDKTG